MQEVPTKRDLLYSVQNTGNKARRLVALEKGTQNDLDYNSRKDETIKQSSTLVLS